MSTIEIRGVVHTNGVDALHEAFALVSWVWTATG